MDNGGGGYRVVCVVVEYSVLYGEGLHGLHVY